MTPVITRSSLGIRVSGGRTSPGPRLTVAVIVATKGAKVKKYPKERRVPNMVRARMVRLRRRKDPRKVSPRGVDPLEGINSFCVTPQLPPPAPSDLLPFSREQNTIAFCVVCAAEIILQPKLLFFLFPFFSPSIMNAYLPLA